MHIPQSLTYASFLVLTCIAFIDYRASVLLVENVSKENDFTTNIIQTSWPKRTRLILCRWYSIIPSTA
jgi:hypothetical protein